MRRWWSGQSQQTVNLSPSGFVGSNPTRRTKGILPKFRASPAVPPCILASSFPHSAIDPKPRGGYTTSHEVPKRQKQKKRHSKAAAHRGPDTRPSKDDWEWHLLHRRDYSNLSGQTGTFKHRGHFARKSPGPLCAPSDEHRPNRESKKGNTQSL